MTADQLAAIVTMINKAASVFELAGWPPRIAIRKALEQIVPQLSDVTELDLQMVRREAYGVE
jgi:hypothetical protein